MKDKTSQKLLFQGLLPQQNLEGPGSQLTEGGGM